ncbi:GUN4 domain-containing protein [Geitlerinema sp. CS-897]|nr:GUN4 domain-containing protein [Geitlerinema sp. CS-897]
MKILHINLKPIGDDYAEFRFFWDNPNDYQSRQLPLTEIFGLLERSKTDYYTRIPEPYVKTGQTLYNWLDGNDRLLENALDRYRRETIVLAIAASERLANLPWELLHDGTQFLVERCPPVVPVRWVADRDRLAVKDDPKNRFLNVLFMATSPRGVKPELDFEAEEGQILNADKKRSLCLTVEESGNLEELGELVEDYDKGYFDVVHLTGHATIDDEKPCFLTETELGDRADSSAEDIARVLQFHYPKLIFLSGCRTGYSSENAVPSMAEALLKEGATAVLSWGDRVKDDDASAAAATLYEALAVGKTVTEALASTYQTLLRSADTNAVLKDVGRGCDRQWHLLRFYVADALPGALVTTPRKRGRKRAPRPSVVPQFIDAKQRLRLLPRTEFVGRRRQLQNCLRTLKTDWEKVGVLLQGMGGWGKSAIAARLCDRLSEYETLVWWRQVDEAQFVTRFGDKLNAREREILQQTAEPLKYRLRDTFEALDEAGEKPFLLVFDDFEWNLEHRDGNYILQPKVAALLEALVWAMQETDSPHRIIITCRYEFQSDLLNDFFVQGLDSFHHADLQKKLRRLEHFDPTQTDEGLIERAIALADGNPRLLEWLDDEVLAQPDAEARLTQLENSSEDWKGKIVWDELYQQIDQPLETILSLCLVYEIPVPMAALEAVCEEQSNYREQLQRAIALGLLEVSSDVEERDRTYRVSRILPRIIPSIQLPSDPERLYSLYRKAWEILTELWGDRENQDEERWREMFRIGFAEKDNPERFREGFDRMLSVQFRPFHQESDRALEAELRLSKSELDRATLCERLECLLQQEKWREADRETAWIFYQLMVLEGQEDFDDLCQTFPSRELNEIDALWVKYSDGHFGFSVQKAIWESVGRHPDVNYETWEDFGKRVSWYDGQKGDWKDLADLNFSVQVSVKGELPATWTTRGWGGGFACGCLEGSVCWAFLFSRIKA